MRPFPSGLMQLKESIRGSCGGHEWQVSYQLLYPEYSLSLCALHSLSFIFQCPISVPFFFWDFFSRVEAHGLFSCYQSQMDFQTVPLSVPLLYSAMKRCERLKYIYIYIYVCMHVSECMCMYIYDILFCFIIIIIIIYKTINHLRITFPCSGFPCGRQAQEAACSSAAGGTTYGATGCHFQGNDNHFFL